MRKSMFGGDEECEFNACVGNNGWVDLSTYSYGFDEAVGFLCTAAIDHQASVDALIYPIIFNARHRIELFIKSELKGIGSIRASLAVPDDKITKTHDLKVLWDILAKLYRQCDRRFIPLVDFCESFVDEFHKIDPKGETFRYPYSQDGIKHLTNRSVIGIKRFFQAYRALTEKLSEMEHLSDCLVAEYGTGTWTKELSRKDLADIANDLPDRATWADPEGNFGAVKIGHMTKYGLSCRRYCEAVKIILRHRQFSALIGVEIPIEYCEAEKLLQLFTIRLKLNGLSHSVRSSLNQEYASVRNEYVNFLMFGLSDEELATVVALHELSAPDEYSEYFDPNFQRNLASAKSDKGSLAGYFSSKAYAAERIELSLKKLGQTSLLRKMGNIDSFKNRPVDRLEDVESIRFPFS